MPGFDGTGPLGRGPLTGWGRGFCIAPAYGGRAGYFRGFGGGWGHGWRNRYYATGIPGWAYERGFARGWWNPAPAWNREEEMEFLENRARWLERELEDIRQRVEELKKEQEDSSE